MCSSLQAMQQMKSDDLVVRASRNNNLFVLQSADSKDKACQVAASREICKRCGTRGEVSLSPCQPCWLWNPPTLKASTLLLSPSIPVYRFPMWNAALHAFTLIAV